MRLLHPVLLLLAFLALTSCTMNLPESVDPNYNKSMQDQPADQR